jgi:hypothetical protein
VVDLRSNVYGNDEQVNDDRFNAPNANARKKKKKKKKGLAPKLNLCTLASTRLRLHLLCMQPRHLKAEQATPPLTERVHHKRSKKQPHGDTNCDLNNAETHVQSHAIQAA